jgi:hypothetical protein
LFEAADLGFGLGEMAVADLLRETLVFGNLALSGEATVFSEAAIALLLGESLLFREATVFLELLRSRVGDILEFGGTTAFLGGTAVFFGAASRFFFSVAGFFKASLFFTILDDAAVKELLGLASGEYTGRNADFRSGNMRGHRS